MEIFDKYIKVIKGYVEKKEKIVIRIYGHGASGKSTFCKILVEQLDNNDINLLETDPYIISSEHRNLAIPKQFPNQKITANMPLSHELNSLKRDILALKNGLDILTIEEPWSKSKILKAAKPILIVEGMSSAFLSKDLFDLSICLKTDPETEFKRRTIRDTRERNQDIEFIKNTQKSRREQYQKFYERFENDANIMIET
ncbi:uridine kinase family protein [Streptococcus catagoni]|uniref:uridine kinase family protein n=1 Tax=Streptococcus catagoni TaxID=2654874 RepID=UPI00140E890C|nr:AAA family ATPase [Streptococcus catagoni]